MVLVLTEGMLNWNKRMKDREKEIGKDEDITFEDHPNPRKIIYN